MVCCQAASYGSAIAHFPMRFTVTELVEHLRSLQETRSVEVGIAWKMICCIQSDINGLDEVRVDCQLSSDCVYAN